MRDCAWDHKETSGVTAVSNSATPVSASNNRFSVTPCTHHCPCGISLRSMLFCVWKGKRRQRHKPQEWQSQKYSPSTKSVVLVFSYNCRDFQDISSVKRVVISLCMGVKNKLLKDKCVNFSHFECWDWNKITIIFLPDTFEQLRL